LGLRPIDHHIQESYKKFSITLDLQVALPELDGALEPIVFAGRDSSTGKSHSLPDRIDSLASRAINWAKYVLALESLGSSQECSKSRIVIEMHSKKTRYFIVRPQKEDYINREDELPLLYPLPPSTSAGRA
jgi:hypothetical protein